MKLSPRTRRNIGRIIPFAVVWVVTGWVFITVEAAAMGTFAPDSPTIIAVDFRIFVFASIAVAIVGFLVGFVEMVFMENLFRNKSFLQKKEIFFTGDVLNAIARIQGMCNQYHAELLASGELASQLQLKNGVIVKPLGTSILKGRAKSMELFALEERREAMSTRLFYFILITTLPLCFPSPKYWINRGMSSME